MKYNFKSLEGMTVNGQEINDVVTVSDPNRKWEDKSQAELLSDMAKVMQLHADTMFKKRIEFKLPMNCQHMEQTLQDKLNCVVYTIGNQTFFTYLCEDCTKKLLEAKGIKNEV